MATSAEAPNPGLEVERLLCALTTKGDWLDISEEELEKLGVLEDSYDREEWRCLDRIRRTEYEERHREFARLRFQGAIRNALIRTWLRENTSIESKWDYERITNKIWIDLRDDQREELSEYLCDVIELGVKKADKKRKRLKLGDWYWTLVVWTVVVALVRLALIFGILQTATGKFETIVFAMLVLIYCEVQSTSRTRSYLNLCTGMAIQSSFNRVLLILKYKELEWEREQRHTDERKAAENISRASVPFLISDLSFGVAWLFVMYKIVAGIFF